MLLTMLKSKIHGAVLTETDLHYEGSIGIDRDVIDAAGMLVHERVDIWNVTNGERFSTYIIEAPRGSRIFSVNGAAARRCHRGDQVIIATFAQMDPDEARHYIPTVVLMDRENGFRLKDN